MARPAKLEESRRTRRLTVYFDKAEEETLNSLAAALETDKTKLIIRALKQYVSGLHEPPEPLRRAKQEAIMQLDRELVSGFVCVNGHGFWIESVWPSPPRSCPACGAKHILAVWGGMVRRGI